MEKMEAFLWLATIKRAKNGDKEQLQHLQEENELRKEKGLPSVEEELLSMANNE